MDKLQCWHFATLYPWHVIYLGWQMGMSVLYNGTEDVRRAHWSKIRDEWQAVGLMVITVTGLKSLQLHNHNICVVCRHIWRTIFQAVIPKSLWFIISAFDEIYIFVLYHVHYNVHNKEAANTWLCTELLS